MRRRFLRSWLTTVVVAATASCAATINPATIADAQTAARVKSVLVNDPDIGMYPIEVYVANGMARLSGRVPLESHAARAVSLTRGVQGVVEVRSELRIGGAPVPDLPVRSEMPEVLDSDLVEDPLGGAGDNRLLAVGGSVGWNGPNVGRLDASESLGPIVRLGAGRGLALSIGFGWFASDLASGAGADEEVIGRVRIRPVMGGLGYTVRDGRLAMTLSAVGGVAFNSVAPNERLSGREIPLQVRSSLAWRPGVSFWFDTSSRVALQVSTGYVMTRPRYLVFDEGKVVSRRLTADAFLVRVGVVYKVF